MYMYVDFIWRLDKVSRSDVSLYIRDDVLGEIIWVECMCIWTRYLVASRNCRFARITENVFNRKYQDYVYVQCEYWSTM